MDPWVQSILSAVVGGVIGGIAVGLTLEMTDKPEPAPATADKGAAKPRGDSDELEARMLSLEAEVRSLRKQNTTARVLGEYARAMAAGEGDAGSHKVTPPVDAEDPVFELAVRSVFDRVEEERRDERRARRAQRSEERARGQADFMADRLQLSPEAKERLQQLMIDQMQKFHDLRHSDPDAGIERPRSREEWRERVDAIRKETDDKLSDVLTDSQLEEYKKLREEQGFDRGGRGGRR